MLNPFLEQFANEPLLIDESAAELFKASLQAIAASEELAIAAKDTSESFWGDGTGTWKDALRPYQVANGVLTIPVRGALLNNFPYQFGGYATGYEYIQKAFDRGMADSEVKGIALAIDSPGGAVAGNFDLVDRMFAARGTKPVRAFASESAYSAAYSIASVADHITVSRTGGVGSIGVVTMHVDMSKAIAQDGYKVTFIYAGKHKVDGNPYEPLPDGVKARIQSRIDELYSVFVATVARNRGIDEKAVRATEALTFTASESLSKNLADKIGTFEDGLAAFAATLNLKKGETTMSEVKDTAAVDQAQIDKAREEGIAQGTKDGASAEQARIKGIMALDAAANRREAALNIALNTNLSVDQSKELLAVLPEEKSAESTAKSKELFDAAMTATGNPNINATAGEPVKEQSDAEKMLADYRAITGQKAS